MHYYVLLTQVTLDILLVINKRQFPIKSLVEIERNERREILATIKVNIFLLLPQRWKRRRRRPLGIDFPVIRGGRKKPEKKANNSMPSVSMRFNGNRSSLPQRESDAACGKFVLPPAAGV